MTNIVLAKRVGIECFDLANLQLFLVQNQTSLQVMEQAILYYCHFYCLS